MEHFVAIHLPSLTFPPNSDTSQIPPCDWRICYNAANQNSGWDSRPEWYRDVMVMMSCKKVSTGRTVTTSLAHHQPDKESDKSSSPSHFICVVNFEKTIMVSMLSRFWSDLHQSSLLLGTLSHGLDGVDRERTNVMCHHLISCYSEVWRCVRPLYLCCDGSQGVMCRPRVTWHSWHVMPRCHSANICPGVTQHCHNGSLKPGG